MSDYDPGVNFSFIVKLTSEAEGQAGMFSEVSGINTLDLDNEEVKVGGEHRFVHKLPGRISHANLVFKRGIVPIDATLATWCRTSLQDIGTNIKQRDLIVRLKNEQQTALMEWHVKDAWPVKWSIALASGPQTELVIEALEFAYAYLEAKYINS